MKTFTIVIGLMLGAIFPGLSQNYKQICTPGVTFFHDAGHNLMAFKTDSLRSLGNGDTIFYSYPAIRGDGTYFSCYDTAHGSILGDKVIGYHDGRFVFFNKHDDTITIKTQIPLNGNWKFCNLPSGWVRATVSSMILDSILGTADSVKVISLQAMDNNNDTISNPLNQVQLKLSVNLGLTQMLDVYYIPDSITIYTLAGKSTPSIGIQNMTWQDIYNFNLGDVFHRTGYYENNGTMEYNWKSIQTVLQKRISNNYDTIIYTLQSCTRTDYTTYTRSVTDTITDTYITGIYNGWAPEPPGLPSEFIRPVSGAWVSGFSANTASFNGRLTKSSNQNCYSWIGNCWELYFFETSEVVQYTRGLGDTYLNTLEIDPNGPTVTHEQLVYFQQGSESWGTPVAADCSTLIGIDDNKNMNPVLELYPNPSSGRIMISTSLRGIAYILDLNGRQLLQQLISSPVTPVDLSNLMPGVYVVKLVSGDQVALGKIVKE